MLARKNSGGVVLKVVGVLVLLAAAGVAGFYNFQSTARVKAAERDNAVDAVTGSVLIHADGGMKDLKSEASGKVVVANIKPGSKFAKDDVLVQLDTTDLDRDITEAQRTYEHTREETKLRREANVDKKVAAEKLETARRMLALGSVSKDDINALERGLDQIELALKIADLNEKKAVDDHRLRMERYATQRAKMSIRAPYDGAVQGALVIEGEVINVGQPVAVVYSSKRVVAAKISEENFGRLQVGQSARLRLLTYGSQEYEAAVSELLPTADEAQRFTVYLDVKVDPEHLKPNSTGEVTITVDQRPDQVMIPRRALFDGDKVFVVSNGRARRRQVEVGYVSLTKVEIRKGIELGEYVIVESLEGSPENFRDGERVRVQVIK
jgi:RND family efflux transporter MFP subunit